MTTPSRITRTQKVDTFVVVGAEGSNHTVNTKLKTYGTIAVQDGLFGRKYIGSGGYEAFSQEQLAELYKELESRLNSGVPIK